jgi:deoxyhypusine synthase
MGKAAMVKRSFHDGRTDGLQPLESLNLAEVRSCADLVRGMGKTSFAGRQLGRAMEILLAMARDPDCTVILTLSGAMTIAKQGRIVCEMIDRGLIDAIISTGALIAHGLTESIGLVHYAVDPEVDDAELFAKGYNRIYDTLEMEANLNDVEYLIASVLSETIPPDGVWSSARLCRALGERLDALAQGPGILRSAWQRKVPVFIPAFTDSEIGLDFATWYIRKGLAAQAENTAEHLTEPLEMFQAVPPFNPFLDLQEYAGLIYHAQRLGILTIGGGVPRNWAQQVSPYFDLINHRLKLGIEERRFQYGVRICPEPVHWGGLSGCTYSEGVSWGKFLPPQRGGRYAEVYADATLAWPLLMKAVFEVLDNEARS